MIALAVVLSLVTASDPLDMGDRRLDGVFRVAGGGVSVGGVEGVAPTLEVGVDLFLASRLGLRLTGGAVVRVGWGGFFALPEVVVRPVGGDHLLSPFLSAGVQVGAYNITDEALGRGQAGLPLFQPAAGGGQTEVPNEGPGGGGATPLALAIGPEATAGVSLRVSEGTVLDLGVRYAPFAWRGDWYHGVAVVLAVGGSLR
ncbi:hypothetical protein [Anaeromyxobacter oryzae]|uniref:Outer membrane protein beta-barrel domain-containing protein n=1 Tax=Anaeromyxobacter oryzae TaxID=2918170 RepID=A0ABM7X3C0_9BACT|nr:hypothetical protein [Anaeromyxobacter oryzae]BDG06301.1 hypothetical protein AMOR_52970 [Anaeromyxobacter oryzae]